MAIVRNLTLALLLFSWMTGCKNRSADPEPAKKEPLVVTPTPPPDDPAVLEEIAAANGVVVKKSGDHIVSLDLRGLFPDAAADQTDEFSWVVGLPQLETILARGPGVTYEAVNQLKNHPAISVITFEDCNQVKDDAVEVIAALENIADINLIKSDITDEALQTLSKSPTIRRIRIARTKVTDAGVAHLETCENLDLLDLLECSQLTNDCAASVGKLTKLRNVKLPAAVDDSGMVYLANLKNLVALGLQYCRIGPAGIQHILGLQELEEINLYGATKINDEVVNMLAHLPKLEKLRLRETSVRGEAAEGFAAMKELQDLDLSESPVQDAVMESLAKLPKLSKLNLWNTEVTDEGIAKLAGMTQLTELNLDNLGDAVSDDSLDTIAGFANLKLLHLGGTGVTDEGMPKLYGLKNLERLFITRTFVIEPATVDALKKQLPNTKIEW